MPKTTVVAIRLTDEQLAQLDRARGAASRADYLRGLISPGPVLSNVTTTARARVMVNGNLVTGGPADPHPSTNPDLFLYRREATPIPKSQKGKR